MQRLERLGARAGEAVPSLALLLGDDETDLRAWAAQCLEAIGPHAASAAHFLAGALWDCDPRVRLCAADALGAIGPAADVALARLQHLADDDNDEEPHVVQGAAARAIARIQPTTASGSASTDEPRWDFGDARA